MLSSWQPLAYLRAQQQLHRAIADSPTFPTQQHCRGSCALAFTPDLLLCAEASGVSLIVWDLACDRRLSECGLPWQRSAPGLGPTIWACASVAWSCDARTLACVAAPCAVLYLVAWSAGQLQLALQRTVQLDGRLVRSATVQWAPCLQRLAVVCTSAADAPPQGWLVSAQGQVLHSWVAQLSLSATCRAQFACCSSNSSMFAAAVQPFEPDDPAAPTSWVGVLRQDCFHLLPVSGSADCLAWAPPVGGTSSSTASSVLICLTRGQLVLIDCGLAVPAAVAMQDSDEPVICMRASLSHVAVLHASGSLRLQRMQPGFRLVDTFRVALPSLGVMRDLPHRLTHGSLLAFSPSCSLVAATYDVREGGSVLAVCSTSRGRLLACHQVDCGSGRADARQGTQLLWSACGRRLLCRQLRQGLFEVNARCASVTGHLLTTGPQPRHIVCGHHSWS